MPVSCVFAGASGVCLACIRSVLEGSQRLGSLSRWVIHIHCIVFFVLNASVQYVWYDADLGGVVFLFLLE